MSDKKKDIGEVISIIIGLNDQNRQLLLYGAQLLERSEMLGKMQKSNKEPDKPARER